MIGTVIIAAIAFAATNIDEVFVLLAFFANPKTKGSDVVVGSCIGMAILVIAAMLLSAVCAALIPNNLGLLGALPILVGLRQLLTVWTGASGETVDIPPGAGTVEVVELVAIRTVANGADNVAVYIPLFAGQSRETAILTCLVFAILGGAWCFGARMTVERPKIAVPISRWGRWITPAVLISLGIFVFFSSYALPS